MDLEKVYQKNMDFLKEYDFVLYDRIDKCYLENIELVITNGMYNIKYKDNIIYPENVDDAISNQLDDFYKQPQLFFHNPAGMKVEGYVKLTSKSIQDLLKHSPLLVSSKYWKNTFLKNMYLETHKKMNTIPFLILFGIGTGEYIKKILEEKKVLNLIIVDNNYEFLKLSMHLINWQEIFTIAKENNTIIKIMIGDKRISKEVFDYIYSYNPMYIYYIQFLVHINSADFDSIIKTLHEELDMLKLGWGFYEDEKISLNNTIMNLKKTKYIFEGSNFINHPVVVVGAGPSLDNDIKLLKEIHTKAIIISCGTALRTLWKYGIKPDFHVDIERLKGTYKALLQVDKKFLKEVTLVGLSVLHPKVKTLFNDFAIFLRPNDAGGSCVSKYRKFKYGSPTCVNAGFDLALSLNPERIYLLGVDCGFRDPSLHHAEDNINIIEESTNYKKQVDYMENKTYPGNFSDEFLTSNILLWSKYYLEFAYKKYTEAGSRINVYNCSDGLKINGAKPRVFNSYDFKDLPIKEDIRKVFIEYSQNELFEQLDKNLNNAEKCFEETISKFLTKIKEKDIKDIDEAVYFLDKSFDLINKEISKNKIVYSLTSGSLKLFYSIIYSHLMASKSLKHIEVDFFNRSVKDILKFLEKIFIEFKRIKNLTLNKKRD